MIPALALIPWRLIGYGVVAAVVLYGGVKITRAISNTIDRAEKYDETQRKLDGLEVRYKETVDRFTRDAADDAQVNGVLTAFGSRLDSQAAAFAAFVSSQQLMRDVPHVDQTTGVVSTCRERDPALFRVLYNGAVDGVTPDAPASVLPY